MYIDSSTRAMIEFWNDMVILFSILVFIVGCATITVVWVIPVLLYEYVAVPTFRFFLDIYYNAKV